MITVQSNQNVGFVQIYVGASQMRVAHNLDSQFTYPEVDNGEWVRVADFTVVKGIGRHVQDALVAKRFTSWTHILTGQDLEKVEGIGPVKAQALRTYAESITSNPATPVKTRIAYAPSDNSTATLYRTWMEGQLARPHGIVAKQIAHLADIDEAGHDITILCGDGEGFVIERAIRWVQVNRPPVTGASATTLEPAQPSLIERAAARFTSDREALAWVAKERAIAAAVNDDQNYNPHQFAQRVMRFLLDSLNPAFKRYMLRRARQLVYSGDEWIGRYGDAPEPEQWAEGGNPYLTWFTIYNQAKLGRVYHGEETVLFVAWDGEAIDITNVPEREFKARTSGKEVPMWVMPEYYRERLDRIAIVHQSPATPMMAKTQRISVERHDGLGYNEHEIVRLIPRIPHPHTQEGEEPDWMGEDEMDLSQAVEIAEFDLYEELDPADDGEASREVEARVAANTRIYLSEPTAAAVTTRPVFRKRPLKGGKWTFEIKVLDPRANASQREWHPTTAAEYRHHERATKLIIKPVRRLAAQPRTTKVTPELTWETYLRERNELYFAHMPRPRKAVPASSPLVHHAAKSSTSRFNRVIRLDKML